MKKVALLQKVIIFAFVFLLALSSNANESLYMSKGIRAEKKGEYREAIREYKKALSENPNFIELYNTIGRLYRYKLKDNQKAIQIYLKGLKIEPYNFGLNRSLMYLYFDQGKLDDGIEQYKILSSIRGERDQYSFTRDTLKKIFKGMTQEAILNFCNEYLAINPTDIILREFLAGIYMKKKDYKYAKQEYKAMITYGNKTGFIYFSIGVCDYYLGLYQDALKSFTKAQELGSYVPQNYFDLIHEKMK